MDYNSKHYERARKKVRAQKKFYKELFSYLGTMGVLFVVNMLTSPGFPWFLFPAFFWGIGIVTSYFKTFGSPVNGFMGPDWEDRKIQEEVERLEQEEEMREWLYSRKKFDEEELEEFNDLDLDEFELKDLDTPKKNKFDDF